MIAARELAVALSDMDELCGLRILNRRFLGVLVPRPCT
jgi:hypothetical protein